MGLGWAGGMAGAPPAVAGGPFAAAAPPRRRRPGRALGLALGLTLAAAWRAPRGCRGAWDLVDRWDDQVKRYTDPYTGERDALGAIRESELLRWEQQGWFHAHPWRTSAGAYPGKDYVDTGLGYSHEEPTSNNPNAQYSNRLRRCGPATDVTSSRKPGCVEDNPDGSPGAGPQQWAYKGQSLGPPEVPTGDGGCALRKDGLPLDPGCRGCSYALSLGRRYLPDGTDCFASPQHVPAYARQAYPTVPLRWGFEEGTFAPFWHLKSAGMPNFAVRDHCFLDAYSGKFQLCSAYPWQRRELNHGLLHVQSVPFVLGAGDLSFESNGGDVTVPAMPRGAEPVEVVGEGVLGVALTRLHDNYRVLQIPVRSRRGWQTEMWNSTVLAPFVGDKFVLDIYDYRCCDWGWMALDAFVIPAYPVEITKVAPAGGPRAGGTTITVSGRGFGSNNDGISMFVGEKECTNVAMISDGSLTCSTPPGSGVGLTVTVAVGDYDWNLEAGPFSAHQASHCGAASTIYPYTDCAVDEDIPRAWGVPERGFTYMDPPEFVTQPALTVRENDFFLYVASAKDPDGDKLRYYAKRLPVWLSFDPTTQTLSGVPLFSDVQCQSDTWHPASERCMGGGNHRVVLAVSDYFFEVTQEFVVNVQENPMPLLPLDKSFHWPSFLEIQKLREAAQREQYHHRIPDALEARRSNRPPEEGPALLEYLDRLNGRDQVENSLRSLLYRLLHQTQIREAEASRLLQVIEYTGYGPSVKDLAVRLKLALRAQERNEKGRTSVSLVALGKQLPGWHQQLINALANDVFGIYVKAYTMDDLTIRIPTVCSNATSVATVSCDFADYVPEHELQVVFDDTGVSIQDVFLQPSDVPHVDIVNEARRRNDIVALVLGLSARISVYQKRYEELANLPPRLQSLWTPRSSVLKVLTRQNVSLAIDIDHSYPLPTPPSVQHTAIGVIQAQGIPFHVPEAMQAMTVEVSELAHGNLSSRLAFLEDRLDHYLRRCINDCNGNGRCDYEAAPPRCECFAGFVHDDCSHIQCPNDCSGVGACDSEQICTQNPDTGESYCVGGSSKCACESPYYGADCSFQPCKRRFAVFDKLNVTLGEAHWRQHFREAYGEYTYALYSEDDGQNSGEGLLLAQTVELKGIMYVEYKGSAAAEDARFNDPHSLDFPAKVGSRGVSIRARSFEDELRVVRQREKLILDYFGRQSPDCTGRGACDYRRGMCYCDSSFFGDACEFTFCPNDCSGHGRCDLNTGECTCDRHYMTDFTLGCKLKPLALASTTCQDEALNEEVLPNGERAAPIMLSCLLGTPLKTKTGASFCPFAGGGCYTTVHQGEVCADCSGYPSRNASEILVTAAEVEMGVAQRGNRGLGLLPAAEVTFHLDELRARDVDFRVFKATAGIVRQWNTCLPPFATACTKNHPQCGASFFVLLDGVQVWEGMVQSDLDIAIDVTAARNMTLRTQSYTPPYWRNSGIQYGGGEAPAIAVDPVRALWCDGSAFSLGRLV